MEITDQVISKPNIRDLGNHGVRDVPLLTRLVGMLLAGAALIAFPQRSQADTVEQSLPASQRECLRNMNALIEDSKGSAMKVELSGVASKSPMARIFVSDGEVRITCNDNSGRMVISRSVNQPDADPSRTVSLLGH